jgi:predicted lipoprotein with Yx(FWY)xxD motif
LRSRDHELSGMLATVNRRSTPTAAAAMCLVLGATLLAGATGCGSSSAGSPDGGGGGGASGSGTLSWQDDGVAHHALFATATLTTSSGLQILQIAGGEASGVGIAFGVSAKPAVGLGAFQCGLGDAGGYPITSFSYTATGVDALYQSCTVSITALGAASGTRASGTFSAVLNKTGGGTKAITAGVFDAALTVSP